MFANYSCPIEARKENLTMFILLNNRSQVAVFTGVANKSSMLYLNLDKCSGVIVRDSYANFKIYQFSLNFLKSLLLYIWSFHSFHYKFGTFKIAIIFQYQIIV